MLDRSTRRPVEKRAHPAIVFPGERPRATPPQPIPTDPMAGLSPELRARLPNLIGIGAGKSGTSALHAYLSAHPEISTSSRRKELKVFGSKNWVAELPWYASNFDPASPVRSETSPTYAMDPYVSGPPEQMAAVLPDPRFVYIVRDPLRRLLAHFQENRSLAFERRSLQEALADVEDQFNPYVAASRYGHQLERYVSVFGRERVLVIDQEELRADRRSTLRRVFQFAGVDPDFWSESFEAEHNASLSKYEPNRLGRFIFDRTSIPKDYRRRAMIPGVTLSPLGKLTLDDALRARLEEVLRPDIAHFRELTGRRFADWPI